MRKLVMIALIGFAAQLVDGGLGMAYGLTSSTLLLLLGAVPATASATVHLAEVGTTFLSGTAHWRLGNVDRQVLWRIALPGALGAFAGATVLSGLDASVSRPVVAVILLGLGIYVLVRFTRTGFDSARLGHRHRRGFLPGLGAVAGFLDAVGGGGWGPIGTPALLVAGRMEPRRVIGTVNAAEFLVTLAAAGGFLVALGASGVAWGWVAALLAGGALAAPLAAWLVRRVPPRPLGVAVGALIVLTNSVSLLRSGALPIPSASVGPLIAVACGLTIAVCVGALVHVARAERQVAGTADQPTDDASGSVAPTSPFSA